MTEAKEMVKVEEKNSWEKAFENENWIAPLVDIVENDDDYILTASMPGVSRENIKIKIEDESLVIMGRINYDEAVKRKYVLKETEIGNFYRKFKISDSIDEEKIEASFENGQVIVKLPKHERVKPKTISIN